MSEFFGHFDIWQVLSSFIFLIAIIDPFGNIPLTLSLEEKGSKIHPMRVCIASFIILLAFLFAGEWILKLFGVQIEYFAVAGGFIIFLMALEMILDVTRFLKPLWMVKVLSFLWLSRCTQDRELSQHYWPFRQSMQLSIYASHWHYAFLFCILYLLAHIG